MIAWLKRRRNSQQFEFSGHKGWVLYIAWSPDGKTLASGSMDNTVRLWDPKTGKALGDGLKGHTKWITCLSWEPYHLYVFIKFEPCFKPTTKTRFHIATQKPIDWQVHQKITQFVFGIRL
jgi:WD40 repeat protein